MSDTHGFASGAHPADLLRPMPPMPPCTGCVELEKRVAALEQSKVADDESVAAYLDRMVQWKLRKGDKPDINDQ